LNFSSMNARGTADPARRGPGRSAGRSCTRPGVTGSSRSGTRPEHPLSSCAPMVYWLMSRAGRHIPTGPSRRRWRRRSQVRVRPVLLPPTAVPGVLPAYSRSGSAADRPSRDLIRGDEALDPSAARWASGSVPDEADRVQQVDRAAPLGRYASPPARRTCAPP